MKDRLTFFPDKHIALANEDIPGFATEKWIQTADGENIQSYLFQHKEPSERQLIIYFHGNAGNLYYRFDAAIRLYQMDHDVLLVSYRGYGKSTGKPNEQGIYIDGTSAINYAIAELGYTENDISIIGRSLGSAVAVHVTQHRSFRSIILITPLTSGSEMATAMGLGLVKFLAGDSYDSLKKINNINCRLLIIHGNKDEVVPYHMGKRLYDAYHGPKSMVTIEGGRHNDLQEIDGGLYWEKIDAFLSES